MTRALVIGIILFVGFLVARAPAGLLPRLVPDDVPVALFELEGTLWRGAADLVVSGQPLGRLGWTFRPVTLLTGSAEYDLSLSGASIDVSGRVKTGVGGTTTTTNGQIGAPFVNAWLSPYNIELSGTFLLEEVHTKATGRRLDDVSGTLTWEGGPIRYQLSGKLYSSALPPLYAALGPGSEATVFAREDATPLLHAALLDSGFGRFGVTKHLTTLLGNPWPGGDPDHAVVLEVEEQLF